MKNRIRTMLQISVFSILFAAAVVAAAPRMGTADVPELPKADGSGASPDMMLDMVPVNVGGATKPARIKLSSLRGKLVLMDIFWSRCHHCEEHAPHIVELYNKYRQRGFTVLGVATDNKDSKDDITSLKNFMAKAKIAYPVGFLTSEIRAYYADPKDAGVPQMVLFGTDGKMVLREVGWNDKTGEKVRKAIEAQLSKTPAAKAGASAAPRKAKA
ncbi:MAG TPA: TlpA disulfide reductase family protein [Blastocatellia bacterium]|nr:TlpA disulfide reductase family protein [Blastocatellia bacterium]HMV83758.1 TlpA disulfide reductase family protein [Blastocatellia bacterium]HMX28011.1 TlpA disulfide reductase family protein [Blastocatellia bacterium]HMY71612.1 TlpA disulfide reductase family protein [Blastocatellia bacterium]HMZ21086.1 TlpA disulfide reductase family protein [Blastocatellia bacterium]